MSALRLSVALVVLWAACRDSRPAAPPASGSLGFRDDLYSVSVIDADHVVAVGDHGAAYWTVDGGRTWGRGDTPIDRPLYAVSMADRANGWAVGQLGAILRTRDGGRRWTIQESPASDPGSHLFGVQALDAQRALAVGSWGAILSTSDGGASWSDHSLRVTPDHPQFAWLTDAERESVRRGGSVREDVVLQHVTCLAGAAACWIVGEFGSILASRDAGVTWERGEIRGDLDALAIRFAPGASQLGEPERAALSTFSAHVAGDAQVVVRIEAFADQRESAAPGATRALAELLDARSAEVSAELEASGLAGDRIRAVGAPPWDDAAGEPDRAAIARYVAQRRAPEGRVVVSALRTPALFTARFADGEHGLAVGAGGAVLSTRDGGRAWTSIATGQRRTLFSVAVAGQRAIAVGEQGALLVSSDAGASWSPLDADRFPPLFGFLRDLELAPGDPRSGFIVGQGASVLRTRDAGESWQQVLPAPTALN